MKSSKDLKISPSLMCINFLEIKQQLDIFIEEGIDYFHIDIMDGHYVSNFTLGIDFCRAISSYSKIPLDIHLMIDNPDNSVELFSSFKNSIISFHPEVSYHSLALIQKIKSYGLKAGIAVDPSLPVEQIIPLIPYLDQIIIMSVNPGYAGQKLIPETLDKIKKLRLLLKDSRYNPDIEIDGNVSWENLPRMLEAGADVFVAGTSSIFEKNSDIRQNIKRFRGILKNFLEGNI